MINHSPGPPSPETAKSKSSSRFAESNVMASAGLRDAVVGPHANKSTQSGSKYGKTGVFTTLLLGRSALPAREALQPVRRVRLT
jgi:hypothetical protein